MSLRDLILRWRSLVRREVVEKELDDELQFHFDQQVTLNQRRGCLMMTPYAKRASRLERSTPLRKSIGTRVGSDCSTMSLATFAMQCANSRARQDSRRLPS